GAQRRFVTRADVFRHCRDAGVVKRCSLRPSVPVPAQQTENGGRIGLLPLSGDVAEYLSNRGKLLGLVVDDKVPLVPQFFNVLAQNTDAQGVERAKCGMRIAVAPWSGVAERVGGRVPSFRGPPCW